MLLTITLATAASRKEIEAYRDASVELNQWARSLQINGEEIPRAPQERNGLEIFWNERLFCYAAPEYEETALDVRVLCQLLQLFKLRADEARENLMQAPIMYLAFAQRKDIISQALAQQYNEKAQKYKIYYNSGKMSFDSLTDPLPWIPTAVQPTPTPLPAPVALEDPTVEPTVESTQPEQASESTTPVAQ